MLQRRQQDLQGHVAIQYGRQIVEHDHVIGVFGDQLEQAHRRQVPALVDVRLADFHLQHRPHGMGFGRARPAEQVQARGVLAGHGADIIADDSLAAFQFRQQVSAVVNDML
jgi:hypothetical protein